MTTGRVCKFSRVQRRLRVVWMLLQLVFPATDVCEAFRWHFLEHASVTLTVSIISLCEQPTVCLLTASLMDIWAVSSCLFSKFPVI